MKLKKFVSVVLSAVMVTASVNTAFAEDSIIIDTTDAYQNDDIASGSSIEVYDDTIEYAVEGGYIYFDADTGEITDCGATVTSADIPDSINGISVTSIGSEAFKECRILTNITIPSSVTSIGDNAFYFCSSLTSITIPSSVTSIGNYAFYACSITSITIPSNVMSIGKGAFYYCSNLTSINVSSDNTEYASLNGVMFNKNLSELVVCPAGKSDNYTIPSNVISIDEGAFYQCKNLTSITIPNSVTSISDNAFYGCSNLTSITIPDNVTSISRRTFTFCSRLTSITMPNCITSIGDGAFYQCNMLKSIDIPSNVTSIGKEAFCFCTKLTSITIPSSVISIGENAFSECHNLTSITISDSVTSIGKGAFYYCTSLTSIDVSSENTTFASLDGVLFNKNLNELITCPGGKSGDYIIPDYVTNIDDYAFYYCSSLTGMFIPNNVTSIGDRAFYHCSSLTSITIPNSVTNIASNAFDNCYALTVYCVQGSIADDISLYPDDSVIVYISDGSTTTESTTESTTTTETTTETTTQSVDYILVVGNDITGDVATNEVLLENSNVKITALQDLRYYNISDNPQTVGDKIYYAYISSTDTNTEAHIDGVSKTGYKFAFSIDALTDSTISVDCCVNMSTVYIVADDGTVTCNYISVAKYVNESEDIIYTTLTFEAEAGTTYYFVSLGSNAPVYGINVVSSNVTYNTDEGNVYIDSETGSVTAIDSSITNLVLPKTTGSTTITGITAEALSGTSLTSITIPATVENIESGAEEYLKDTVIIAEEYSYAYNFALANNLTYEKLMLYTLGDADGNGELSAADAASVLQKVLNASYELPIEGEVVSIKTYVNVQGNEELTASDAACILQKVLNGSFTFPVE